jgi:hypothetical protein
MIYTRPNIAKTDSSLKMVQGSRHGSKGSGGCLDNNQVTGPSSNGAYEVDE